jgi:hypothetical protein
MRWIFFSIDLIQPHYGPGVDSASNRNEYQEDSWGVKRGRRARLTTLPPSVSRLYRRCESLDLSHPYGPSWLVTRIALLFTYLRNMKVMSCSLPLPICEHPPNRGMRFWYYNYVHVSFRVALTLHMATRKGHVMQQDSTLVRNT